MSMNKIYSYAQFPATRVAAACVKWQKLREERIEARKEKRIAEVMKPTKHWFGLVTRTLTREQAIQQLTSTESRLTSEFDSIENFGSFWAERVQELHALATCSKETVAIDAELFDCIASFYSEDDS